MKDYSRLKLYALGEPLGDSATRKVGNRTIYGFGGGSSSSPQAASTTNNVLAQYAAPYAQNLLGQASALTQTPYQQYNGPSQVGAPGQSSQTYANGQVAGSTALQNQAYGNIANMQAAPQIGQGTNVANTASNTALGYGSVGAGLGLGGLGYGAGAAGYGAQGAQIGQNVANMSTNPAAVQAYMNPYLQTSLAPQLQLLNQQYGIAGQQEQGAATQAGAFGGSREALMNSLNSQNQMLAQNQLVGNAYNTAFNNAQNQMNQAASLGLQGTAQGMAGQQAGLQGINTALQGAGVGLQGAGTALQGANTLGALGQNQYTQNAGITQAQLTAGTQQQALNQQIANTLYGSYANQLNQPYNQLGFMSSILQGLPIGGTQTQQYVAPAPLTNQLASLGLGAYGVSKAFGRKGGNVKMDNIGKTRNKMGEGLAEAALFKAMGGRA
ncbi:MAG TPA: hypothetical protein PLQ34_08995 [Ferrovaceae bacterium]|nr:hypothetical protein [Ferrovaceae bacterium]